MDEPQKKICGEKKTFGRFTFVCNREPHIHNVRVRKRNHRDGIFFYDEPPAESHRFVNPARL